MSELEDEYIPITTDIYLKSFFESQGITVIWIADYLSKTEIKKIYLDVSALVDYFIGRLDDKNNKLYEKLFGREDIRLFYATMKLLFKRFVFGVYQAQIGIEKIILKHNISRLFYLHDGYPQLLCGNIQQKSFIFPQILYLTVRQWRITKKMTVPIPSIITANRSLLLKIL